MLRSRLASSSYIFYSPLLVLTRALSSFQVFGWAQMGFNNSGGMPLAEAGTGVRGGEPGDAPSEYYYYYYAPHSLNPRQPQPQHGGASAVASSLALEGYDDRYVHAYDNISALCSLFSSDLTPSPPQC